MKRAAELEELKDRIDSLQRERDDLLENQENLKAEYDAKLRVTRE